MSRYALRHTDPAGHTHRWTCASTSAHYVARWLAADAGLPVEVLCDRRSDGRWRRVATWFPDGRSDPDTVRFDEDEVAERYECPDGPLYATLRAEQPYLSGTGWVEPAEDDSAGCEDEPCVVYVRPVTNYAAL